MADLKPCPFCGGEKLKIESKSRYYGTNGLDRPIYYATYSVRCNVCHARGGAIGGKVVEPSIITGSLPMWAKSEEQLKAEAIEAWNRRVNK